MSDNALGRGLDALIQKPETTKKNKRRMLNMRMKIIIIMHYLMKKFKKLRMK